MSGLSLSDGRFFCVVHRLLIYRWEGKWCVGDTRYYLPHTQCGGVRVGPSMACRRHATESEECPMAQGIAFCFRGMRIGLV